MFSHILGDCIGKLEPPLCWWDEECEIVDIDLLNDEFALIGIGKEKIDVSFSVVVEFSKDLSCSKLTRCQKLTKLKRKAFYKVRGF